MKLDLQYDNYTDVQVEGFHQKLSKILHLLSQGILHLCQVDFQLMFRVPSFVQKEIFPLSKEQEKALAAMGVIKLTCGEYQFPVKLLMFLFVYCKLWNEALVVYLMWSL